MATSNDILRGTSLHVRRQISDLLDSLIPSGGAAPADADYLVKTANGTLSAERVVTDTATVTWDWSVAGQAKANASAGITQLTGDVTAGPGSGSQAATLATVNSNVGTFGSATKVAVVTVNAKGLTTAVTEATITASGSGWTYSTKNASFNASPNNVYEVTANNVVATLDASWPAAGRVRFAINAGVTGFSVARNGNKIQNTTNDLSVSYTPYDFELFGTTNNGLTIMSA